MSKRLLSLASLVTLSTSHGGWDVANLPRPAGRLADPDALVVDGRAELKRRLRRDGGPHATAREHHGGVLVQNRPKRSRRVVTRVPSGPRRSSERAQTTRRRATVAGTRSNHPSTRGRRWKGLKPPVDSWPSLESAQTTRQRLTAIAGESSNHPSARGRHERERPSQADPDELERILERIADKPVDWPAASPCSGTGARADVVLVVVDRIYDVHGSDDEAQVNDATRRLARGLHDKWGVGDASCSSGALALLSIRDRSFYLSVGAGLRDGGLLSDGRAGRALNAAKPSLRRGDVGGGCEAVAFQVQKFIDAGPPSWGERLGDLAGVIFFVALFGGVFLYAWYQSRRDRRQRADYDAATRHLRTVERIRDGQDFAAESCPVCLEDFGNGRRATTLPCGHAFCEPCLGRWLADHATCPVCRATVADAPSATTRSTTTRRPDPSDEVRFRLDRIHRRYPTVLERRALDAIVRRGFRGPLARDPSIVSLRPAAPRPSQTSNSSPGRAYGGGRSAGGAGGRW